MADKTFRELSADATPALTKLVALQAPGDASEPTKTSLTELIAVIKGELSEVADTGDYGDLLNLPTLGALAAEDTVGTALLDNDSVTFAKMQELSANVLMGASSAGNPVEIACTAAGRAILDDADAAAQRTTLGCGTIATQAANNVALTGGSLDALVIRQPDTEKTASFTFAAGDDNDIIKANHATVAVVGTVPANATVAFAVGTVLIIYQHGAAAASFAAAGGVTINKPADRTLVARVQNSHIGVRKIDTNVWVAFGDLASA